MFSKKRLHYKNRLKLRKGSTIYFLFSEPTKDKVYWRYKHHSYIVRDNKLQTYINKKISWNNTYKTS